METIPNIEQSIRKLKTESLSAASAAKEAVSKAKSLKEQFRQAKAIYKEAKKVAKEAKRIAKQTRKELEDAELTLEAARNAQAEAKFNSIVQAHSRDGQSILAEEPPKLAGSAN